MSVSFEEQLNYYGRFIKDVSEPDIKKLGNSPLFVGKELRNASLQAITQGTTVSYTMNGITKTVFEQASKAYNATGLTRAGNSYKVSFIGITPGIPAYMTVTFSGLTSGTKYWMVIDQLGLEGISDGGKYGEYLVQSTSGTKLADVFAPTDETIKSLDTSYVEFTANSSEVVLVVYPGNLLNNYCMFNGIYINKANTSTEQSFYPEITGSFTDVDVHVHIPANTIISANPGCTVYSNEINREKVVAGFYHVVVNDDLFMMLDTSVGVSNATYGIMNNLVGYADPYHVRCVAVPVDDGYNIVPQVLIEESWIDFDLADFSYELSYKRIAEF